MDTRTGGARAPRRFWLTTALCAWGAVVFGYWGALAAHSRAPGTKRIPPHLSAVSATFQTREHRYLLVMAVHPKCPCTRASSDELARLVSTFQDRLDCVVLVFRPENESDDWTETGFVAALRREPNTRVLVDVEGRQALELGMSTSGSVALYSPQGLPQYWGGITSARGHAGDNLGSDAIADLLRGRQPTSSSQPVYGCHIQTERDVSGS